MTALGEQAAPVEHGDAGLILAGLGALWVLGQLFGNSGGGGGPGTGTRGGWGRRRK